MHWRGSATWKWHGWMKITRSGGRAGRRRYPLRALRCLSLRLDNRPTVEKSSRPIRNHQFSLGPYAPWYRFNLKTGKKPTIAWTDSTIYRLLPTECQLDLGISAFDQIFLPRTLCFVFVFELEVFAPDKIFNLWFFMDEMNSCELFKKKEKLGTIE